MELTVDVLVELALTNTLEGKAAAVDLMERYGIIAMAMNNMGARPDRWMAETYITGWQVLSPTSYEHVTEAVARCVLALHELNRRMG